MSATISATIDPDPTEGERKAILVALAGTADADEGWAATALREGLEDGELDP